MPHTTDATQAESRTEQVNVRLTLAEKQDVRLVADFDRTTESDVMRTHALARVVKRASDIRSGRVKAAAS